MSWRKGGERHTSSPPPANLKSHLRNSLAKLEKEETAKEGGAYTEAPLVLFVSLFFTLSLIFLLSNNSPFPILFFPLQSLTSSHTQTKKLGTRSQGLPSVSRTQQ